MAAGFREASFGQTTTDPTLAQVAGVYSGLESTLITTQGEAAAAGTAATGASAEAAAYGTASGISAEAARVAGYAGDIALYQQQLQVQKSLGGARAAYGASGAALSGSALDIMRSSLQQGALGGQLIEAQTAQAQAGYQEASSAYTAEQAGANAQYNTSIAEQNAYDKLAAQAQQELDDLTARYGSKETIRAGAGLAGGGAANWQAAQPLVTYGFSSQARV